VGRPIGAPWPFIVAWLWYDLSIMSDESKARVVLELWVGDDHEHIIGIEDPDVIPSVGDKVDFANLYNYSVAERSIRFYGSFGPDRSVLC